MWFGKRHQYGETRAISSGTSKPTELSLTPFGGRMVSTARRRRRASALANRPWRNVGHACRDQNAFDGNGRPTKKLWKINCRSPDESISVNQSYRETSA